MNFSAWFGRFQRTLSSLLRILIPAYLAVALLQALGWIERLSAWLGAPLGWIGVGAEGVVPLTLGLVASLYGALGSMISLGLTAYQALPVVVFLNFAHALPLEVGIARQCQVNPWRIAAARIAMGAVVTLLVTLFRPILMGPPAAPQTPGPSVPAPGATLPETNRAMAVFVNSLGGLVETIGLLAVIMAAVTLAMELFERRGLLDRWSRWLAPYMGRFGFSGEAAFPLLAGLFLGMVYGGGIIIDGMGRGRLSEREAWLIFLFLGACHSVLEDPFVFSAVGVGPHILLPLRLAAGGLVLLSMNLASYRAGRPVPASQRPA